MPWILLTVAGLLEVGWALGLKYTEGFTRPLPTALTGAALVASMVLMGVAVRDLPIGTAYGVWVGIGAVGTAIGGMVLFDEPATLVRVLLIGGLVACLVGLKVASGH